MLPCQKLIDRYPRESLKCGLKIIFQSVTTPSEQALLKPVKTYQHFEKITHHVYFFLLKSKSILAENLEPFILHEQTFQFRVTTGQVVGQTQSCAQEKHLTWLKKQRVARTSPQIGVQGHRWVICFSRTASGWQQQFDYKVKRSDKIGIVYKKLRKTVLGLSSSGEIWSEQLSSTLVSLLL